MASSVDQTAVRAMLKGTDAVVLHVLSALGVPVTVVRVWEQVGGHGLLAHAVPLHALACIMRPVLPVGLPLAVTRRGSSLCCPHHPSPPPSAGAPNA